MVETPSPVVDVVRPSLPPPVKTTQQSSAKTPQQSKSMDITRFTKERPKAEEVLPAKKDNKEAVVINMVEDDDDEMEEVVKGIKTPGAGGTGSAGVVIDIVDVDGDDGDVVVKKKSKRRKLAQKEEEKEEEEEEEMEMDNEMKVWLCELWCIYKGGCYLHR